MGCLSASTQGPEKIEVAGDTDVPVERVLHWVVAHSMSVGIPCSLQGKWTDAFA